MRKDMENEGRHLRVDTLNEKAHNSVCAVKLLFVHAIRIAVKPRSKDTEIGPKN
jgi:hypothetical protein